MSSGITFFYFWEILKHLELNPYLRIPMEFDHQACYQEALAAADQFVEHRNYKTHSDGSPKWKSLALRALDGDHTKTLYHKDYGVNSDPNYQMTEMAERFPETLSFLNQLTDIQQCERIRFMLLEPHAKIDVHTDAPGGRAVVACNVALNMPEGCEFLMETNPDGSLNSFSKKVPFVDGSVMLVNVAKYHFVENKSDIPRVHMIVHGPLKMSQDDLIQIARRENDIADEKDLVTAINLKRALQGLDLSDEDLQEWLHYTLNTDRIHKRLKIIVLKSDTSDESDDESLRMTVASLFPLQHKVVKQSDLDTTLAAMKWESNTHVAVVKAGHYIGNCYRFVYETFRMIGQMTKNDAPLAAHLLYGGRQFPTPQIHDQFFILDLSAWTAAGQPSFNRLSMETAPSPFEASRDHIHDDYTPCWIKRGAGKEILNGKIGFGTYVLNTLLDRHSQIINVSRELRAQKIYTYPEKENSSELKQVRRILDDRFQFEKKKVYAFNNEPRNAVSIHTFKPQTLLSVAAGFKPMALCAQYPTLLEPYAKIHFLDFSSKSLRYEADLSKCRDFSQVKKTIAPYWTKDMPLPLSEALDAELSMAFKDDSDLLFRSLHKMREASFEECNFYSQAEDILARIEKGKPALFWHSNAFNNNLSFFSYSKTQIDRIYQALIDKIQNKIGGRVFTHKWHREVIFTDSTLDSILMVMTDGVQQGEIDWSRYTEINTAPEPH